MFMSHEEIIELTGKRKKAQQFRALQAMGIEFKVRPDGHLVVLKSYVERILSGESPYNTRQKKKSEPNWSAINAPTSQTRKQGIAETMVSPSRSVLLPSTAGHDARMGQ